MSEAGSAWNDAEIAAVVEGYFEMLVKELMEEPYVKADANRTMQALTGRSKGSIEYKLQNVTAALVEAGARGIDGYKPMSNIQEALRRAVHRRLDDDPKMVTLLREDARRPLAECRTDLAWQFVEPPDNVVPFRPRSGRTARRVDYLSIEQARRDLGLAGEEAVLALERRRLVEAGCHRLADRVEHVSVSQGDGLGYDILSFEPSGKEKLVEVKTTRRLRQYPFFVSSNEVSLSDEQPDHFHLYRVFGLGQPGQGHFELPGSLNASCDLDPRIYAARIRQRSIA